MLTYSFTPSGIPVSALRVQGLADPFSHVLEMVPAEPVRRSGDRRQHLASQTGQLGPCYRREVGIFCHGPEEQKG
jgi:hypothetical protein